MSMFHELMMRKKEEIMYATIKGTLTENDGVFSGFSASNYLQLQNYFYPNTNNWSIMLSLSLENLTTQCYFFSVGTNSFISSVQKNNNDTYKFFIYKRKLDNSGWDFVKSSSNINLSQTNIYVKIGWNGSSYTLDYSYDGRNWINIISEDSSNPIMQTGSDILYLGIWRSSSSYFFTGTIDLPNSYIKIGATKYKIVAVPEE